MNRLSEELSTIKTNNKKYLFILVFFIVVYSALITYQANIIYHIVFIGGSILFTIRYEKIERELATVKMKNFYIKAKLSYKIEELEKQIKKNKNDFEKEILQNVLNEIEL